MIPKIRSHLQSRPLSDWLELSVIAAWILVIILLPITSLPLLNKLTSSDMVAPASALPLLWVIFIWFLPYIVKKGKLPSQMIPLLGFVFVVIIASAVALMTNTPPLKGKDVLVRELQSFLTLMIGVAFYIIVSTWPRSEKRLQLTMQLLNFTGLVLILWSLLQAFFWYKDNAYPSFMYVVQGILSNKEFYQYRVNGFAFEPSWFAHQLNMAFLPFWLAATIERTSAHRFRIYKFSFENFLLLGGLAVLYLSFSRVGWLAFALSVSYLVIKGTLWLANTLQQKLISHFKEGISFNRFITGGLKIAILAIFLIAFVGSVLGVAYVGSKVDKRLAKIFQIPSSTQVSSFIEYANYLDFAERVVYWETGWAIFNDHPFLGVGLGNAGFYFRQYMPAFSWQLTEVDTLFSWDTYLPNTKSMWSRILAETGIIGFAFFIAWLFILWQSSHALSKSKKPALKTFGLAGTLTLIAFLIEGFSIDSFALPYIWFSMGVLTAACATMRAMEQSGEQTT